MPWVLSARSASGLAARALSLASHLEANPSVPIVDVGHALATSHAPLEHRAVVVGADRGVLLDGIAALAGGRPSTSVIQGVADVEDPASGVVFVFAGHGSQWPGMAVGLLERSPVFSRHLRACAEALSAYVDFSVEGVLRGESGQPTLDRVDVVQPILFAVTVSLAALWRSAGVQPDAVVGHSQGEVAAAHVAGGLSLDDAARVVALRSRALARIAGRGGMVAVGLSPAQLSERLDGLAEKVSIAAVNGPASVAVAGELDALQDLIRRCEAEGIRARRVRIDYASHSPDIEAIRGELLEALGSIAPRSGDVPFYSAVTGQVLDTSKLNAEYWYQAERSPVQLDRVVRELLREGHRAFVEISPHPVLTAGIQDTVDAASTDPERVSVIASLRRQEGDSERFLTSLAGAYVRGVDVDWGALFKDAGAQRLELPADVLEPVGSPQDDDRADSFVGRVVGLPGRERDRVVLEVVLTQVAAVLGRGSTDGLDQRRTFKELGFDSPSTVELRNRLNAATGLRLPASLLFDYPTPAEVRDCLVGEITGVRRSNDAPSVVPVDEPLVIVGMACRYPGGASSPEEFWRLIESRGDAIGEFPTDRGWDLERLYDPDPNQAGTSYTRHGGFLYDAGEFDAEHFSISPREALAMDPQQRLLLETAWEALEDAGIDPLTLRGSQTGVFVGAMSQDYGSRLHEAAQSQGYALTGSTVSVASGRVAYAFGFEGPAVSVDTACSSSLVALHLACQALRQGECSLALVGGVAVMANPGMFVEFSRQRGLSPDGRCRAFGAGASGTSWSEGAGVILVERLSEAERQGHRVLALIRGSAINQDGASNGLTAPNGPSQERVIRRALASAGLSPSEVDVVEAHGTGTTLGDPIEAGALLATYGQERTNGPLYLGSVKSNIGHTQAAAGVAGVIKMVLALRHEVIPPTLWAEEPSPHVDWEAGEIRLLTESVPWPADGRPRRAGVSSFGISGTNSHVILEEAPTAAAERTEEPGDRVLELGRLLPVLVSGSSEGALRAQAGRLRGFVQQRSELDLGRMAAGLALGRAALSYRGVALTDGLDQLVELLGALERGERVDGLVEGIARGEGRVALIFPGQGSQWAGMGWELWQSSRVFAELMQECSQALGRYVGWSLEAALRGDVGGPSLERVDVVQPALFAVMVSLAGLWRSCGVEPAAVVGHSQGEIAAAYVAGALSLDDAARVVALRSRLVGEQLSGRGRMVSIAEPAKSVGLRLEQFAGRISMAAINGPSAVVVSGENEALDRLLAECEADGVRARNIPVDYAAHSVQIEALRERMLDELSVLTPRTPEIPFYSTVTGAPLDGVPLDGEYWYRNLRETVQFEQAIRAAADTATTLIETSPHPVLTVAVEDTIDATGRDTGTHAVIGSLRRDDGGPDRFLAALAQAHAHGIDIDWRAVFDRHTAAETELPSYAFQRQRYWLSPKTEAGDPSSLGQSVDQHPLVGAMVPLADGGVLLTGRLSLDAHSWLADHAVWGTVLLPGAAFLELALHAGAQVGCDVVEELTVAAPLVLDQQRAVHLQLMVSAADEEGRREMSIHSRVEGASESGSEWMLHASGLLMEAQVAAGFEAWMPEGELVDAESVYDRFAELGYDYGPAFQPLRETFFSPSGGVCAEVRLGEELVSTASGFGVHPVLCDGALQAAVLGSLESQRSARPLVPFTFSHVRLHRQGVSSFRVRAGSGEARHEIVAVDEDGAVVLSIGSVQLRAIEPGQLSAGRQGAPDDLFALRWTELDRASENPALRAAVLGESEHAPADAAGYPSLAALERAIDGGADVPEVVLAEVQASPTADALVPRVHEVTERTLALLQSWLASSALAESRLVVLTCGAVAVGEGESPDLALAALPGLLRSAHSEHPDRFGLVDVGGSESSRAAVSAALACGEAEVAVRQGALLAPRVVRHAPGNTAAAAWRLAVESPGTLETLRETENPSAQAPLGAGQVRIAMRAAGLNFHDVVAALNLIPGDTEVGIEGAGVVSEVADDVCDLQVGDRVMGLIPRAFGPIAVAERNRLIRIPDGWSFGQAASVPAVFLTAYYGLVDLARLGRGERVLVHGAAGGVGMAALQLARHLGTEVFATAHPDKWQTLTELGLDEAHIASSRSTEFKDKFLQQTDGAGVDVVLGSLAGEMVDASLALLPRGGRYVEMGKTDIRDAEQIASEHSAVSYRAFDLLQTAPNRLSEMLAEVVALFEQGILEHLPLTTFDVRDGRRAFRYLRESRHTGKIVLRVPQPLDPNGTVLITGGTGGLGMLQAKHLAAHHHTRHLLLVSRRGREASGASELAAELERYGCQVEIAACDTTNRSELKKLIDGIPPERPLTAVIHAAGVLDDALISSLDPQRLHRVMAPKLDAAVNLHQLTEDVELSEFILYSSASATLGSPGQGNYAAANTFLDALAHQRRTDGRPAISLAFGVWERATGMTGHLAGSGSVTTSAMDWIPLGDEEGIELIDLARSADHPLLLPMRLDLPALRARARAGVLPAIMSELVQVRSRAAGSRSSLAKTLAAAPEAERDQIALELVRGHVAAVLGHGAAETLDRDRAFKELGFDSLAAVELRNRLNAVTGLKLPATLIFDHPTPAAVARLLRDTIEGAERPAKAPARRTAPVDEPLAIVGMACRYPGGVSSPEELWRLLKSGGDAIGAFPTDRGWDLERLYDPDPDHPGTSYTRHGGFLSDAAEFDAEHFSISPREALAMDPQQRLLLETAWEALEDAGIDPLTLKGTATGVFAGAYSSDYGVGQAVPPELEGFRVTGGVTSVISGRIAYTFGLEGPAVSVDTACSSSLVALHLAGQALRQGECSLALVGGVSVLATPSLFVDLSRQGALSPDGRCRAFGAGANGTGFSDGAGVILVERLSNAQRNGRRVLALITGSAINQDGASNGLTAPNGPSQERVIRAALASAGLAPGDVDAVEAHGTGTSLGDPIEAQAVIATYGQGRSEGSVYLGSLKSNIGHTQAAAGVGGVIKMVMAMRRGVLPKTLWAEEPSPHVDWESGAVRLLSEAREWVGGERVRRAGVSSFGISGTNAHVILEEPPALDASEGPQEHEPVAVLSGGVLPFLVSGTSEGALRAQAGRLREFVQQRSDVDPDGVAAALALGRATLSHRAVALADGRDELVRLLGSLERGEPADALVQGVARGEGRVAFVFPGQGSQWVRMGVELMERSPVFAAHMRECFEALAPHVEFSLEGVLQGDPGQPAMDRVEVIHPALFAVMVSLARLWESIGVRPDVVVGHSLGEIAAAHIAGGLSLQDAARVVSLRSQALATVAGRDGAMVSVALSAEELTERLGRLDERLWLGVVNGPGSVVVSGDLEAVNGLLERCDAAGVRARVIADVASHSPYMKAIREQVLDTLAPVTARSGQVPLCSTVTGGLMDTARMDAEHWYQGLCQTVQFEQAVRELVRSGYRTFIEISPHPVLTVAVQGIVDEEFHESEQVAVLATLRRDDGGPDRFLASTAEAHAHGADIDWGALLDRRAAAAVELPTYAFQHRHYWLTPTPQAGDVTAAGLDASDHPLLGAIVPLASGEVVFTGRLSLESHPWLADHAVMGTVLFPATAFLEIALHAAAETGSAGIQELTLAAPLVLDEQRAVHLQVWLSAADDRRRRTLEIHSRPDAAGADTDADWTLRCSGVLTSDGEDDATGPAEPAPHAWPEGAERLERDDLYDRLAEAGHEYGPAFQAVREALRTSHEVYAEARLAGEQVSQARTYELHPALSHAAVQAAALLGSQKIGEPLAPSAFRAVRLYRRGVSSVRLRVAQSEDGAELVGLDGSGMPVFSIGSVQLRPIAPGQLTAGGLVSHDCLYAVRWVEVALSANDGWPPAVATLGEGEGLPVGDAGRAYPDLASLEEAVAAGVPAPDVVLAEVGRPTGRSGLVEAVHEVTERTFELVKAWVDSPALADARLVLVTRGALAVSRGEAPDLHFAALPGLVRSAHSEHPDRFALVDADGSVAPGASLAAAWLSGESEVAIREGALYVPRVARVKDVGSLPRSSERGRRLQESHGTILITGGTGGLGALEARHLAARHGARHILLVSRRGPAARGAAKLVDELAELGCEVRVAACDVADRAQLEAVIREIPSQRPLTAVVHAAGVLDDGMISSLDGERLRRVMAPKVDAAIHLHELTADLELSEFILYSSAPSTLGSPGQGNYAAANGFLDALAQARRATGLPAISLAFGLWGRATGMSDQLSNPVSVSVGPMDLLPMEDEDGLELIDLACDSDQPLVLPMRFDQAALRARARDTALPPIMSGLVRVPARRQSESESESESEASFAQSLVAAPESDRDEIALRLVRAHVAGLLRHGSLEAIEKDRPFRELGFDSLSSVQLRNRIFEATGLKLPRSLTFDHPTPAAVARLLRDSVEGAQRPVARAAEDLTPAATPDDARTERQPDGEEIAIGSALRASAGRRPVAVRAIRRAAITALTSTRTRRLYPMRLALPLIDAYAAVAQRRGALPWDMSRRFYAELLAYTPLAGTEDDVARRAIAEFFRVQEMFWRPWLMTRGEIDGLEHYETARSEGRGVVAVCGHFGNFAAQAPVMRRHGIDASIIVSPHTLAGVGNGYGGRSARQATKYLEMLGADGVLARAGGATGPDEDAFSRSLRLLRDGATVSLTFDMVGTLPTPFLGRRVMLAAGPTELAYTTDALVVPFVHGTRGQLPIIRFAPPLDPRRFNGPESLQEAIAAVMEKWVLERPEAVWPLAEQPGGAPLINGPPLNPPPRSEVGEESDTPTADVTAVVPQSPDGQHAIRSGWRGSARKRSLPARAIRRAAITAFTTTGLRRLYPIRLAFPLIDAYSAVAQLRRSPHWIENRRFYRELLAYTPLAGTEDEVARRAIVEFFRGNEMFWRPWLMMRGEIDGLEHYETARSQGRGVVAVCSHFSNAYAQAAIMARYGIDIWVIASPHTLEDTGEGFAGRRARQARKYVELLGDNRAIVRGAGAATRSEEDAFSRSVDLLRNRATVSLAFDNVGTLPTPFLGRRLMLSAGPTELAYATNAIVVPFVHSMRGHHPIIKFAPPLDPQHFDGPESLQAAIAAVMEKWAIERPESVWPLEAQPWPPLITGEPLAETAPVERPEVYAAPRHE